MAENREHSRDELTEEASAQRLNELRQQGQVIQSKELTSLIGLFFSGGLAIVLMPRSIAILSRYFKSIFTMDLSQGTTKMELMYFSKEFFFQSIEVLCFVAGPICFCAFAASVLGSFLQVGPLFTFETLAFDLDKVNPLNGFNRLFSKRIALELMRILLKVLSLGIVAVVLLKSQIFESWGFLWIDLLANSLIVAEKMRSLFFGSLLVLGFFAGFDYWLNKLDFDKNSRMTKQEAKQENREREGDPQIKARIRTIQRQIARRRMMNDVKKADVLITNPTHFAVAIQYDRSKMSAPKVVAKGADLLAQRMKQIAASSQVPQVENVALARTLYKNVKTGASIPRNLYQAVAEVLAYVYKLKQRIH